ncbi:MAG: cupin domain-containing protein [Gammaproteobacteria bacterium]
MSDDQRDERLADADAAAIAAALAPVAPAREAAAALKRRILHAARGVAGAAQVVRARQRDWVKLGPRVAICLLREEPGSRSYLLRIEPGGRLPAHDHDQDEECYLVEGEVTIGDDLHLAAGDYQFVPAGARHPQMHSVQGCIAFIRGQPKFRGESLLRLYGRLF